MRAFNCLQFTACLCGMPYLISWLHTNPFDYSSAAKWTCVVGYVIMGIMNCVMVYESKTFE